MLQYLDEIYIFEENYVILKTTSWTLNKCSAKKLFAAKKTVSKTLDTQIMAPPKMLLYKIWPPLKSCHANLGPPLYAPAPPGLK